MTTTTTTLPNHQFQRPIGVWILTVYAGLFYGIQPIVFELFSLLFGSEKQSYTIFASIITFILFVLQVVTVFVATKVWKGRINFGNLLAILVVLQSVCHIVSRIRWLLPLIGDSAQPAHFIEYYQILSLWDIATNVLLSLTYLIYFFREKALFSSEKGLLANYIKGSIPQGKKEYAILVGSLTVFIHWLMKVPFNIVLAEMVNKILSMPNELIAMGLRLLVPSNPQFYSYSTSSQLLVDSIYTPVIGAFFWFGVGLVMASFVRQFRWAIILSLVVKFILMLMAAGVVFLAILAL
jgi:hypothetical protein